MCGGFVDPVLLRRMGVSAVDGLTGLRPNLTVVVYVGGLKMDDS